MKRRALDLFTLVAQQQGIPREVVKARYWMALHGLRNPPPERLQIVGSLLAGKSGRAKRPCSR